MPSKRQRVWVPTGRGWRYTFQLPHFGTLGPLDAELLACPDGWGLLWDGGELRPVELTNENSPGARPGLPEI